MAAYWGAEGKAVYSKAIAVPAFLLHGHQTSQRTHRPANVGKHTFASVERESTCALANGTEGSLLRAVQPDFPRHRSQPGARTWWLFTSLHTLLTKATALFTSGPESMLLSCAHKALCFCKILKHVLSHNRTIIGLLFRPSHWFVLIYKCLLGLVPSYLCNYMCKRHNLALMSTSRAFIKFFCFKRAFVLFYFVTSSVCTVHVSRNSFLRVGLYLSVDVYWPLWLNYFFSP